MENRLAEGTAEGAAGNPGGDARSNGQGVPLIEGPAPSGWQVTVGELVWNESEVTVDEAVDIARLAGGAWEVLDPMRSIPGAAAIVTVLLAKRGGLGLKAATAFVNALPYVDLFACITKG